MRLKLIFAVLLLSTAMPALAQVVAQGNSASMPYYVGGGYSRFSPDWGPGRTFDGLNAYAGLTFHSLPLHLSGLGVEAEWRDNFFNQTTGKGFDISTVKQTTMGGGVTYKFLHWNRYHPYGKYFLETGTAHYGCFLPSGTYSSDCNTKSLVEVMGGGLEVLTAKHIWFRADYSYESWPNLFGLNKNLNPVGVTIGLMYDFHR